MVPIGRAFVNTRPVDSSALTGAFVIQPPLRLFIELSLVIENHHAPF